jgi:plastocyanin domain-containing protein
VTNTRRFVWSSMALLTLAAGCAPRGGHALAIQVTDRGFEPAALRIPKGQPVTLTITRRTDATCATDVVFPSLGQRYALPLNQPVSITLPASAAGKIDYHCGMNMISGSIVVQ